MCLVEKKLKAEKKIKKFFLELQKKLNPLMLTHLFSAVASGFDEIIKRIYLWIDSDYDRNSTIFLSSIILYAVTVSLLVALWSIIIILG